MADTKISALAAVTSLGDTDEAVLAVSGASKKITGANIRASAFDATSPSTQAFGDSAVVGTATTAAHRDHKHAMPALGTGSTNACAGDDSRLSDTRTPTDNTVTSAKIVDGAIVNADVNGSAGIVYSKLSLGSSIVSADIVDATIVQGDLAAAAITSLSGLATGWTVVVKSGDQSVTSNATPALDSELKFTSVNGAHYEFEFLPVYGSPAGAGTPDINLIVGEDATVRGIVLFIGLSTTDGGSSTANSVSTSASSVSRGTAAADRIMLIRGSFTGGGGTFGLLWSQTTSGSNATIMRAGSILRYRRVL